LSYAPIVLNSIHMLRGALYIFNVINLVFYRRKLAEQFELPL
jgi:hypothetical protein